ncbi:MAG TPA: hypothetical protein VFB36_01800 [Nevskiaceae bacterium]|nr:hypothetical protein [Nevskiaceae bacterium]
MNEHDRDDEAVPGLRGLRMHEQPSRDLWPGIATRIALKRSRNRNVFLAAAACTLIAISAMLSLRMTEAPAPTKAPLVAPPELAAMTLPRADLRANRALVKANLKLTQNAESEVRKALRQSPDDPSLKRLLDSTRAQKRELHDLLLADRN